MRSLKIALLSRWYWEENRRTRTAAGGTVQQLAEAVATLGHEVVVLSQSPDAQTLTKSQIGSLEAWLSPRTERRGGWATLRDRWEKAKYGHRKVQSDALDLGEFMAARGPFDVLWAQCEEPDGLIAGHAAGLGIKIPPTLTQIYALRYGFKAGAPVFDEKRALRIAFRHATRVLANSELVAEKLSAYADSTLTTDVLQEKTRVVYHNLQSEFLEAAGTEGLPAEAGRVLFLGALNEKKGALDFLDAVLLTESGQAGATFAMAGGVTERNPLFTREWNARMAQMASCKKSGQLELVGKVSSAEIIAQIQRASVVVLPSLFDEFSRALVEALALGRPVITTTGVGAASFVRSSTAGLVIPPGDPAALARAIDELLRANKPYAENAKHVATRIAHELSPRAIALQIVHHLSEICTS